MIELNQKLCEEQAETKKLIEESKNPKKFSKDLIFNFFLNIICSGIATILYEDYNSVLIFISIFFLTISSIKFCVIYKKSKATNNLTNDIT